MITMASIQSTTLETLMTHSGHTNVKMLKRYLGWGLHSAEEVGRAKTASANLWLG